MKLGIIGTGRIAARVVKELAAVAEFELTAVYNPNLEHAQDFVHFAEKSLRELQIGSGMIHVTASKDLDEFTASVDAVYIASPHGTHYEYALRMLQAGRHVICEKPMAFRADQVRELYEMAGMKGVCIMEGIKTAYLPGFKKIEEVVSSAVIGDIVDVEAAFTRLTAPGCREYDDHVYGGSFSEFGTYTMLPIFRFLGTDYQELEFMSIDAETGVDGYTKAVFTYGDTKSSDGIHRSVSAMATSVTGLNVKREGQLLISGTLGYILVPSPWWFTRYFEVRYEDPGRVERFECGFEGAGLKFEFSEFAQRISGTAPCTEVSYQEEREAEVRAGVYESFGLGTVIP